MKLKDHAMYCCGVVTAEEIVYGVRLVPVPVKDDYGNTHQHMLANDETWAEHFQQIEDHQKEYRRNCAMMVLVPGWPAAVQAEKNGYKKVFEFFNPNSNHLNGVYVKTLWANQSEYRAQVGSKEYIVPVSSRWSNNNGEFIVENGKRTSVLVKETN